jgi:hypothetical protein
MKFKVLKDHFFEKLIQLEIETDEEIVDQEVIINLL